MLLSDAIEAFCHARKGVVAESTRKLYKQRLSYLAGFFGNVDVESLGLENLREFRAYLLDKTTRYDEHPFRPVANRGLSRWTVHGVVKDTRVFFAWLKEEGMISHNHALRLELPTLPDPNPKAITPHDLEKMLREAKASSERDYALLCFMADTGARLSAIVSLRVEDVDLSAMQADVWEKGKGGQGQAHTVFFSDATTVALQAYLAVRPGVTSSLMWIGERGPLSGEGVYRLLRRLAKRAGVTGPCNPHAFRHARALQILDQSGDLALVQAVLGHSSPEVTIKYYGRRSRRRIGELARRSSPVAGAHSSGSEPVPDSD